MKRFKVLAIVFCILFMPCAIAEESSNELLMKARTSVARGDIKAALELADKALKSDEKNMKAYFLRGQLFDLHRDFPRAIADFNSVLRSEPESAAVLQARGCAYFRNGDFDQSIADFDKVIELDPQQSPHHWQRGIALYYAKRFADGRKQFELHQTVNGNDVENAAWHYLCVARIEGVEKARAALIEIRRDGRVPMMEVFALFGGKAKPEDVIAAAKAGNPSAENLKNQLFYAHLYLGLYFEAAGDDKLAREHIFKSVDAFSSEGYMGDVARVHAAVLRKAAK